MYSSQKNLPTILKNTIFIEIKLTCLLDYLFTHLFISQDERRLGERNIDNKKADHIFWASSMNNLSASVFLIDEICGHLTQFCVDWWLIFRTRNKQTHQPMALDVLCQSALECETIGLEAQQQNDGVSAPFAHCAGVDDWRN